MGTWIKQNLVLVSGIVLPVLLVAGFFVLSQAPRILADPPKYGFLLVGYHFDYQHPGSYDLTFDVRDGYLTGRAVPKAAGNSNPYRHYANIFRYNVNDNAFEEILFELPDDVESIEKPIPIEITATTGLKLDKSSDSPDGYRFEFLANRGRGGLLGEMFGMNRRYDSDYVLTKDHAYLDLPDPSINPSYYYQDLHFLGWVIEEESPREHP